METPYSFMATSGKRGEIRGVGGSAARQAQNDKRYSWDTSCGMELLLSAAPAPAPPARRGSRVGLPRVPHSRSILNVSSVAGSVRTMSGSFSMWSPSKVKGSILSSSRGNWESASKLTSPTPAKELVSSFDKLGGDSPVTAGKRKRKVSVGLGKYTFARQTRHQTACKNSGITSWTKAEVQMRSISPRFQLDELRICQSTPKPSQWPKTK